MTAPATSAHASDPARTPTLLLIDGHGLAFRAFHAVRANLATTKGEPTNAVFGFTTMLLAVLERYRPDQIVMTFDLGRTFRHDLSAAYKATRAAMPDELRQQMARIRQLVAAFDIPIREVPGYEADDVIGTLSAKAARANYRVTIVTGDSDMLQLVGPGVEVVTPGANNSFSDLRSYDVDAVRERFGFDPPLVPDYKALVGDTSDNIAGVPGIGEKTAKALLAQFGGLEAIREHLAEVKPPRARAALEEHFETAVASRHLATIVRDMDLDLDLGPSEGGFDREAVIKLFQELEFRTLASRIPTAWSPEAEAVAVPVEQPGYATTVITTTEQLAALVAELERGEPWAVDVETTELDPIRAGLVGIAIATSASQSYYVPVAHDGARQLPLEQIREALGPVFRDPAVPKYTHHGKYDLLVLRRAGIELDGVTFDTMIAAYLLGESSVGLKELAFTRLGLEMTPIEELIGRGKKQITMAGVDVARCAAYASSDVHATYRLVEPFGRELRERELLHVFETIELPLVRVLANMEMAGITLDIDHLKSLSKRLDRVLKERETEIYELAGHEVNINSPQQLGRLLFEELQLPSKRRTQSGGLSTSQDVLEELRDKHPIVEAILEYRQLGKLKSTYVDSLPQMVNPATGRIHTSFNQTIASTGRLSSVTPNLQNIPIRTEVGREVRRAFIADNSSKHRLFPDEQARLLSADYSQVELRILAHLSRDEHLVAAFERGEDIHRRTAALVYGIPLEDVTAEQRRVAKSANFGLIYGLSAYGLSRDTGMPVSQANQFIEAYFEQYPRVRTYLRGSREMAARSGYVQSISGRRRYIPDILSSNPAKRQAAERMAINMPVQGTAADLIKEAMIEIAAALPARGLRGKLLLQVHDELLFETPEGEVAELAACVRELMVGASSKAGLIVPLEVDVRAGTNWDQLEPVES